MNMELERHDSGKDGIFGELFSIATDSRFCVTLEHAYPDGILYRPKVPPGIYTCKRGMHQLPNHPDTFETFEVLGVEGHTGILFHAGNYNENSTGCILLGQQIGRRDDIPNGKMITNSRLTFQKFLDLQKGCDTFQLTIS